jgi:hypothetical protein
MAASRFVEVTDEEISNFKENAVPKSTKEATKFGLKLFRGRKLYTLQNSAKLYFTY